MTDKGRVNKTALLDECLDRDLLDADTVDLLVGSNRLDRIAVRLRRLVHDPKYSQPTSEFDFSPEEEAIASDVEEVFKNIDKMQEYYKNIVTGKTKIKWNHVDEAIITLVNINLLRKYLDA